jgi:hypothetical protein
VKPGADRCVRMRMRSLVAIALLAACGGTNPPRGGATEPPGVVTDSRPEIVKRRDAACEALRPRLVQCTVDDARVELEVGRMSTQDFDANTSPGILERHGQDWMDKCNVDMSSRQVRVLEVCFQEEQECGPLISCLEHLKPRGG